MNVTGGIRQNNIVQLLENAGLGEKMVASRAPGENPQQEEVVLRAAVGNDRGGEKGVPRRGGRGDGLQVVENVHEQFLHVSTRVILRKK